ncbi:HNH endonuclease [Tardiphaga sp. 841_E9_N1_2]|uniref:HNH endonuclease n=1 Tax=Tardiphaga sp. 841_E9_N1_2 TaxID=3240762 RepID=UPI003F205956
MSTVEEVWRIVPGFENYEVSTFGNFRRSDTKNPIEPSLNNRNGYLHVRLGEGMCWKTLRAHRLVLLAHVGPCPYGQIARHLDGTRTNNRLDNLEWNTPSVNQMDRRRHGTSNGAHRGEAHHHAKMTDSDILDAKCLAAAGMSQSKIAEIYGCSQSSVSMILNDKRRPYRTEQQQA